MADVYALDFETNDFSEVDFNQNCSIVTADPHCGVYCLRSPTTQDYIRETLVSNYTELYARCYAKLESLPTSSGEDVQIMAFREGSFNFQRA